LGRDKSLTAGHALKYFSERTYFRFRTLAGINDTIVASARMPPRPRQGDPLRLSGSFAVEVEFARRHAEDFCLQ
jgi:hypothetical protein